MQADKVVADIYQILSENAFTLSTDTRKIVPGCVFFALKGLNFDGNTFVEKALELGAVAAVCDDASVVSNPKIICVDDTLIALQQVARLHREKVNPTVIGITGSNGKTTTKELVHGVLAKRYRTHATAGNFNNHIGVPLTLLAMPLDTEFAIIEMGANHPGEVMELCEIAKPDFGIITSIGKEHLEGFGSLEAIIQTEGEVYDYVNKHNGTVFVNSDDALVADRAKGISSTFIYGTAKDVDCIGKLQGADPFVRFKWETVISKIHSAPEVKTQMVGKYNFANVLAAASIGRFFSVPYDQINDAISKYVPKNNRSQFLEIGSNHVILDAYNANPHSMKLAVENLIDQKNKIRIAVLGDMLELGDFSFDEHSDILTQLKVAGISHAYFIGPEFLKVKNNFSEMQNWLFTETVQELKNQITIGDFNDSIILIKGSRGLKLEEWLS